MIEYKYLSYEPDKRIDDILKELKELADNEGWELVSYSQERGFGMSVILERFY